MAELTTVARLKRSLSITGTTYDTPLAEILESAEDRIRRECGKGEGVFATGSRTEKRPGSGFEVLYLTHRPVTAITSVKVYSGSASYSTIDSTTYRINDEASGVLLGGLTLPIAWDTGEAWPPRSGLFRAYGGGPVGAYPYTEVIYTGGYSTIPDDLAEIAVWYASQLWFGRVLNAGVQSESLDKYSYALANSEGSADTVLAKLRDRLGPFIVQM